MSFHRLILKYVYPKPRRKTVTFLFVLVVIAAVYIFSVERTSHRKHIKNHLIPTEQENVNDLLQEEVYTMNIEKETNNIDKISKNSISNDRYLSKDGSRKIPGISHENKGQHIPAIKKNIPGSSAKFHHLGVNRLAPGKFESPSRLVSIQNAYNLTIEISKSVLVFTGSDTEKSVTKENLKNLFRSMKTTFDFLVWNKMDNYYTTMPRFIDKYGNPRYQTFLFTSENIFDEFDAYSWELMQRYCTEFDIGIIILCNPPGVGSGPEMIRSKQLKQLPLTFLYGVDTHHLKDVHLPASDVLKLVKTPNILRGQLPGKKHIFFHSKHKTFEPIMLTNIHPMNDGRKRREVNLKENTILNNSFSSLDELPLVLYDRGEIDGVRKFFFGVSFWESWLYQLVFVDSLQILSNGILGNNSQRYVQVDVDDIFVGKTGRRLVKEDIKVCSQLYLFCFFKYQSILFFGIKPPIQKWWQ